MADCDRLEVLILGAWWQALAMSITEDLAGPHRFHYDVLHPANNTPLSPRILENKFYARGVGPVLALDLSPHVATEQLVRVERP